MYRGLDLSSQTKEFSKMNCLNAARCGFIALSFLAASCTATRAPQGPTGSDDNGANCGGTAANQKNCINNQNRMNTDPAP
jgi:hypothetical protein